MLAHTAATQGRVAADNLLGHASEYDQDKDCGVTFSRPQAGFVGLSVAQAKAKGIDAVEAKMPMSIDAKAMITGETEGMIKLVADKASKQAFPAEANVGLRVGAELTRRGVFTRAVGDSICFAPPLVTTEQQIDRIVEALGEAISATSM